eukprot:6365708-Ditylum_brightwellii.AAC.2
MAHAKTFFPSENFKAKSGQRYLGGFMGEGKSVFVMKKVLEWVTSVKQFLPWYTYSHKWYIQASASHPNMSGHTCS